MAIVQNDSQSLTQEELDMFPKLTSENIDSFNTQVLFCLYLKNLFYLILLIFFISV